jgi:hypothetical protein
MDLARRFRAHGLQVCIGGFHVSGVLAMLKELTPELLEAGELGVSLFAGEAEGRLDKVLIDALHDRLQPVYNFMDDLPSLEGAPAPMLEARRVKRTAGAQSSFDAGRGCPFQCSFCTIINVQGRKSRHRDADDIEAIVRANMAQGIQRFFITDDDFARNKNWESIFDRLIWLQDPARGDDQLYFRLVIQVDTLCHTIPNFIEKAGKAGVKRVFIGLENINPDSLKSAKKGQNRITEYRRMLQAWRAIKVVTTAGYILGFPGDTPESIVRDIRVIQRELPVDMLEFFYLTPLPGSADHLELVRKGVSMDPDLNKYDLNHITVAHDTMSPQEWERACRLAWDTYFSVEHVETLLRRARVDGINMGKIVGTALAFYGSVVYERVHPLESGFLRLKGRTDRRPGLPIESPLTFYPRYVANLVWKYWKVAMYARHLVPLRRRIQRDPEAIHYRDLALSPVQDEGGEELELYTMTPSAREAVVRETARAQRAKSRA